MENEPPEAVQQIQVPSGEREVVVGTVSAGETWSFSAAGKWKTGFVWCGADGYRNFLYDALELAPRAPREARLKLMGRFRDEPDRIAFPIGAAKVSMNGLPIVIDRKGKLHEVLNAPVAAAGPGAAGSASC